MVQTLGRTTFISPRASKAKAKLDARRPPQPPTFPDNNAMTDIVLVERDGDIATVILNRPNVACRIGHLGSFNELMLLGTLSGVEMGLDIAGVPFSKGGLDAAMAYLAHPDDATGNAKAAE